MPKEVRISPGPKPRIQIFRPLPICGMTKGARAIFQLVSTVNASFITYLRKTIFPDYNPAIGKNSSETVMSSPVLQRAPAAERNKAPILETLKTILPVPSNNEKLQILEIASGTGQHIAHFAQSLPQVEWQPSEVSSTSLRSIEQYIAFYNLKNVKPPLMIDIVKPTGEWPSPLNSPQSLDAILCTNMIHITPWTCTEGLFSSANYLLKPGGLLITYGPYSVNGVLTPESNVNFDAGLRQQNPLWGIRDVKDLEQLGAQQKLELHQRFDLPANNKILVFRKVLYIHWLRETMCTV
ncbi:unnamed protein product [Allacma fusca]|uniref:Methyltransferase-like 26 n=1 Tax=Allacma fusca TaxID=39272 RepID=A0A8J2JWL2_9HEXA|nr:unnamed protein product [Allacma fusca]